MPRLGGVVVAVGVPETEVGVVETVVVESCAIFARVSGPR
jgi:hypothetical protein